MKCPYEVNIEQANQNRYEYDCDGHNVFHEHKLLEHRKFLECLKEECAVFVAGHCRYEK